MNELLVLPAEPEDSHHLFEWRNDPVTRASSLSSEPVPWADHERWFTAALANPLRHIYVVRDGDMAIGVVRFDVDDTTETAEASINVNPTQRGQGYGRRALLASIRRFERECPRVTTLTARIREANKASVALFEGARFQLELTRDGVRHYRRTLAPPR